MNGRLIPQRLHQLYIFDAQSCNYLIAEVKSRDSENLLNQVLEPGVRHHVQDHVIFA